jgi:hypothetical protein
MGADENAEPQAKTFRPIELPVTTLYEEGAVEVGVDQAGQLVIVVPALPPDAAA